MVQNDTYIIMYTLAEIEQKFNIKARVLKNQHRLGNIALTKIGNKYYTSEQNVIDYINRNTFKGIK